MPISSFSCPLPQSFCNNLTSFSLDLLLLKHEVPLHKTCQHQLKVAYLVVVYFFFDTWKIGIPTKHGWYIYLQLVGRECTFESAAEVQSSRKINYSVLYYDNYEVYRKAAVPLDYPDLSVQFGPRGALKQRMKTRSAEYIAHGHTQSLFHVELKLTVSFPYSHII